MIKIVSFTICPFVQRVTAALEAKKIPYEIEFISLRNKPQWFLELSPNGQVPLLVTEQGTALFESDAIVEYIDDQYGAINPNASNEEKALERAWSYLATKHYLIQCGAMGSKTQEILTERAEKLRNAFSKMEKQLSGKTRFFDANEIGKVDIAWLPLLHRAAIIENHSQFDFLHGFPKIKQWQQEILKTGLAEKSVSNDFLEKFHAFYLTNTFLAANEDIAI